MGIKHGMCNINIIDAQQAKCLNNDKNTRLKLLTGLLRMALTSAKKCRNMG